jgi:SAM-dependent methyltransferase
MSKFQYMQFEDRFRGSRDDIQRRQTIYLPVIARLKSIYPEARLLDLGCGRGEWLELSLKDGWQALGIDLDRGMIEHCLALGLKVEQVDALSYLSAQADQTISVVTGLHIAEHVSFDVLQEILQEIYRVLRPGGIMILETPNPENIVVGTCSFYLDPSHRSPLPPDLLSFLTECYGFHQFKIVRLNESPHFFPAKISLEGVLYGVSPDYALIAQKGASPDIIGSVQPWAELEGRGFSLVEASKAFDIALHRHLDGFATSQDLGLVASQVEEKVTAYRQELHGEMTAYRQELHGKMTELQGEMNAYRQELHGKMTELHGEMNACRQVINAVYSSSSWRLTAPLRGIAMGARWLRRGSIAWLSFAPGCRPRRLLWKALMIGRQNSLLKAFLLKVLSPFPNLKTRLKDMGRTDFPPPSPLTDDEVLLNPGAREIYEDLKKAMNEEKKL